MFSIFSRFFADLVSSMSVCSGKASVDTITPLWLCWTLHSYLAMLRLLSSVYYADGRSHVCLAKLSWPFIVKNHVASHSQRVILLRGPGPFWAGYTTALCHWATAQFSLSMSVNFFVDRQLFSTYRRTSIYPTAYINTSFRKVTSVLNLAVDELLRFHHVTM
jgi:hypothetical protein